MTLNQFKLVALGAILPGLLFCSFADAASIVVDEFGNGLGTLGSFIGPDPGPGGLGAVLTYKLPFIGKAGDVIFGGEPGLVFGGDVIRFNGNGTLIFYSDNIPGFDAPADTPGPPGVLRTNVAGPIPETGPEGNNGAFYTPLFGQPGFDLNGPTYLFISDGALPSAVPEPTTLLLLGTTMAGLGLAGWRRRRQS